jgi:hypothetical protein
VIDKSNCFSVDIKVLRSARKKVDFDIYMALTEDSLTKIFSAETGIDYKRLAKYITKGVCELYVHNNDRQNL